MPQEFLNSIIKRTQELILSRLDELIPDDGEKLTEAMRYSLLGTGKRLRPLLLMETAKLFTIVDYEDLATVASAVEMIHTFSLIHDDLPAMDNDDYRRGELACHKKFTEYEAILAGDSLIPLASEIIISKTNSLTDREKCQIILAISQAIGYKGMCLGQSLDVKCEKLNKSKSILEAERINVYKTGYLFKSCVEIGCILGKASRKDKERLIDYSLNFGKAFQLMDDLEDEEIESKYITETKEKIAKLVNNCLDILGGLRSKNKDAINTLVLLAEFCLKNN